MLAERADPRERVLEPARRHPHGYTGRRSHAALGASIRGGSLASLGLGSLAPAGSGPLRPLALLLLLGYRWWQAGWGVRAGVLGPRSARPLASGPSAPPGLVPTTSPLWAAASTTTVPAP